jgi:hypothetical protein
MAHPPEPVMPAPDEPLRLAGNPEDAAPRETLGTLPVHAHGIIDQTQYTILVTVVVGSACVPTCIAQTWFQPVYARAAMTSPAEAASPIRQEHAHLLATPAIKPVSRPEAASHRDRGDHAS